MDTVNSEKQEESVPLTSSSANTPSSYGKELDSKDGGSTNGSPPLKKTNTVNIIITIVVFLVVLVLLIVMFILVINSAGKKGITTITTATTTTTTTTTTTKTVTTTLKSLPPTSGVPTISHSTWGLMVLCCSIIIGMII